MLGRTAGHLYWTFRYLERAENMARLVDAGFRIALTHSSSVDNEWVSVLQATSSQEAYDALNDTYATRTVVNFLLRESANPSSVLAAMQCARTNARAARTALTREVWEAVNGAWIQICEALNRPVAQSNLPAVLTLIRQQCALVRGAMRGTMLRNDIFGFSEMGMLVERADATARILDVKYYVLLPSASLVGSRIDNIQWETILRAVSADRAFNWLNGGEISASAIADFLIFDRRLPRSLSYCYHAMEQTFGYLGRDLTDPPDSYRTVREATRRLDTLTVADVLESGLHEFVEAFIAANNALGRQFECDFRFLE